MERNLDNELVNQFIAGSEKAFNELIRKYQKTIYWHARRMVGNHLDADEITQQVIIVIYNKIKNFKFKSSVKTWIYKITQTRSLNLIRKRKIKSFLSLDSSEKKDVAYSEDIITNFEDKEKLEKVNEMLNKLPTKQKEVFILRHFEELNYEEISKITGRSIGGLKANYFHASKKIMGLMNNEK